jgi:nucleotide-binding universal stress UspA family protein
MENELTALGLKAKCRIERGIPIREILRVEEEEKVSAIIIGSHGLSNLEEVFLGSVSEKVVRKCKGPVLVIKR